jgi:predicted HicB family RNase H-like nuclease
MRKTAEQPASDSLIPQKQQETVEWLNSASIEELRDFQHDAGTASPPFQRAQNVLNIRLSEKLSEQISSLATQTTQLVNLADSLNAAALRMERQTRTLVRLTWALLILTACLVGLTLKLIKLP